MSFDSLKSYRQKSLNEDVTKTNEYETIWFGLLEYNSNSAHNTHTNAKHVYITRNTEHKEAMVMFGML